MSTSAEEQSFCSSAVLSFISSVATSIGFKFTCCSQFIGILFFTYGNEFEAIKMLRLNYYLKTICSNSQIKEKNSWCLILPILSLENTLAPYYFRNEGEILFMRHLGAIMTTYGKTIQFITQPYLCKLVTEQQNNERLEFQLHFPAGQLLLVCIKKDQVKQGVIMLSPTYQSRLCGVYTVLLYSLAFCLIMYKEPQTQIC